MKIYIKSYLDSFIPMLRVYMEWLENAIKLIVKSCEYKYEDFEEFIVTMPHEEEQTE